MPLHDGMAVSIANERSELVSIPTLFLGLGSNVNAEENLRRCAAVLREVFDPSTELRVTFSRVYRTSPRDVTDQPDFLNAVARVETNLTLEETFAQTSAIEARLGKRIPYPKGPRTIDIDILLYGTQKLKTNQLVVPHARLHERRFVLEPLCDLLNPNETHPLLTISWRELLRKNLDQVVAVTEIRL